MEEELEPNVGAPRGDLNADDDRHGGNEANHHWVETLFPPAFGFALSELKDADRKQDEVELSVFEKVAHKISPLDASAIKNVYERVWLMKYLEEEEKMKRQEQQEEEQVEDITSVDELSGSFQRTSTPIGQRSLPMRHHAKKKKSVQTSTADISENAPIDVDDSCIWSSKEIEVLRAVFRTAREQNVKLRATLKGKQEQLDDLQKKAKTQNQLLEKRSRALQEASKANQRLQILCENLQGQSEKASRQVDILQKELVRVKEERSVDLREMHDLRIALDRERLDRKKSELELQNQTQEAMREQALREGNLKLEHQEDVDFLQKKIRDLDQALLEERKDHDRSKKGLEHLRKHFASLPLQGEPVSGKGVTSDQLSKLSY